MKTRMCGPGVAIRGFRDIRWRTAGSVINALRIHGIAEYAVSARVASCTLVAAVAAGRGSVYWLGRKMARL
jgi:hypothetical protein